MPSDDGGQFHWKNEWPKHLKTHWGLQLSYRSQNHAGLPHYTNAEKGFLFHRKYKNDTVAGPGAPTQAPALHNPESYYNQSFQKSERHYRKNVQPSCFVPNHW